MLWLGKPPLFCSPSLLGSLSVSFSFSIPFLFSVFFLFPVLLLFPVEALLEGLEGNPIAGVLSAILVNDLQVVLTMQAVN